jgi:hypothetical protein
VPGTDLEECRCGRGHYHPPFTACHRCSCTRFRAVPDPRDSFDANDTPVSESGDLPPCDECNESFERHQDRAAAVSAEEARLREVALTLAVRARRRPTGLVAALVTPNVFAVADQFAEYIRTGTRPAWASPAVPATKENE